MNLVREKYLPKLALLRNRTKKASEEFLSKYENDVLDYRQAISEGVTKVLKNLQEDAAKISGGNRIVQTLVEQATEYVDWLQWTFWDLPYFAVALQPPREKFRSSVAACGMIYLSIRIFDDILDRHFWYKGKRPTLLGITTETYPNSQAAEVLTILGGLLLCFEGLSELTDPSMECLNKTLRQAILSIKSTVIGAIMEMTPREEWSLEYYKRLIYLKNVEYWHSLYIAIDSNKNSAFYNILERYYALSQILNDVQDYPEDERRNQPNLISLYLTPSQKGLSLHGPVSGKPAAPAPVIVEDLIASEIFEIVEMSDKLENPARQIVMLKLNESLELAYQIGLFAGAEHESAKQVSDGQNPLQLEWYAEINDIIEHVGPDALEAVDCPICGNPRRSSIFRKQGFNYHRCLDCSHIYVSPRINPGLQEQIGNDLEEKDIENDFLEIQRIYAAFMCDFIRSRASGPRVLDIGFGRGYLMQLSKAFGFETYGIDSSPKQVERLKAQFGNRVCRASLGRDKIPWGAFDVIVMSHILEHMSNPSDVLKEISEVMNPGAMLYIVVPDMDSVQFRIFGKNLEFINPLAHFQYFTEKSLTRLLEDNGFCMLEKVKTPLIPEEIAPRWMKLIQNLGGNESGQLSMIAYSPEKSISRKKIDRQKRQPGGNKCV